MSYNIICSIFKDEADETIEFIVEQVNPKMRWEKTFEAKDIKNTRVDYVLKRFKGQAGKNKVKLNILENYSTAQILFKDFVDEEIKLELPRKASDVDP